MNGWIKLNFAFQRGSTHQGGLSWRNHLFASFSWDTQAGASDLACCRCGPRGCGNPSHSTSCCQDWQGDIKFILVELKHVFSFLFRAKETRIWSLCQTPRTGDKYSKFVPTQGMSLWSTGLLKRTWFLIFSYWRPFQHVRAGHQAWWHRQKCSRSGLGFIILHLVWQCWPLIGQSWLILDVDWRRIFIQHFRMLSQSWTLTTASHSAKREVW